MTGPVGQLAGRRPSEHDDADRLVLERVAGGELDALEELYDRFPRRSDRSPSVRTGPEPSPRLARVRPG